MFILLILLIIIMSTKVVSVNLNTDDLDWLKKEGYNVSYITRTLITSFVNTRKEE